MTTGDKPQDKAAKTLHDWQAPLPEMPRRQSSQAHLVQQRRPDVMQCGQCKAELQDENPDLPGDRVPPCPHCGSRARIRQIFGSANIAISAMATATAAVTNVTGLLLQAIVDRGTKLSDGNLIVAVAPAWQTIIALLEKDPSLAFQIDARKWEEIIAGAYKQAGFDDVILTPRSGDLGRDVIAVKNGYWSVRIIDQVKAFAPDHRVPANDVRALIGVLQTDLGTSKGIVTTTSDFAPKIATDPFIAPLIPHRLELVNGPQLMKRLKDIAAGFKI